MKIITVLLTCILLGGCLGLGLQNLTEGQIKATEGMATCTKVQTAYGSGASVTVHQDAARKGIDATGEVVISPDCSITIKSGSQGKPAPAVPPAAKP